MSVNIPNLLQSKMQKIPRLAHMPHIACITEHRRRLPAIVLSSNPAENNIYFEINRPVFAVFMNKFFITGIDLNKHQTTQSILYLSHMMAQFT